MILDESVLLRLIGTPGVMAGQLEYLSRLAAAPGARLQVAELAEPQPSLSPSFTLLNLDGAGVSGIGCVAGIGGQVSFARRDADAQAMHASFDAFSRTALSAGGSVRLIEKAAGYWRSLA